MAAEEEVVILARLAGTRQFLINAEELGVAIEELGIKSDATGAAFGRTTRRGYLMNQALFTVRRLMYGVTLATIASGVAAVKWGFDFNSAMQQARVALGPVFSSTSALNHELDYLFNFTKYTPFQFRDITIAFRQMYGAFHPLGISVSETNQTIKSMVDALAFVGRTSPGALNKVAVALQHMAFQGRLTGQTTLQLARDGLPIYAVLRNELGLTADQIHHIGQLSIPTSVVLRGLIEYIRKTPGYANAAHRQATMSLHGLFTTFKDNLSQLMGAVEMGFFGRMQHNLARMDAWFNRFSKTVRGGNLDDIVRAIGGPGAVIIVNQLIGILHNLWLLFKAFVSELVHSKAVWATIIISAGVLHGALSVLYHTLFLWMPLLQILIPLWVTYKVVTILDTIATWQNTYAKIANKTAVKDLTFFQWLFIAAQRTGIATLIAERLWLLRSAAAMLILNLRTKAMAIVDGLYALATIGATIVTDLFAASVAALDVALTALWAIIMANPITLIVIAVAAVIAGLVILYFKWKWFHNLINTTAIFIWRGLTQPFRVAYDMIMRTWNLVRNFWDFLHGKRGAHGGSGGIVTGILKDVAKLAVPGLGLIPGMAGGGTVLTAGLARVGESGPEILRLPRGAKIEPLSASGSMLAGGQVQRQPLVVQVLLPNKKVLAEAYAEVALDAGARA